MQTNETLSDPLPARPRRLGLWDQARRGRLRSGLGAGFRSCECLGLPHRRSPANSASEEEMSLRNLDLASSVVYDIGANIGIFSLYFARQAGPKGRVVAFEPDPANFAKLCRNLDLNHVTNAVALPMALGARAEVRAAYAMAGSNGRMTVARPSGDDRYVAVGSLAVTPLDDVAAAHRLPPPAFVKMDVEGAELDVLRGGEQLLRSARPQMIIELHGDGALDKSRRAAALLALLVQWGYQVVHVETAAALHPGGYVPGVGHWLCSPQ